ncbi:MAG TPA: 2-C-methyl-D-erythritol 4-phosphate cytidylyltransferase, partial [Flavobacteriales bacterium]|nr:2-C-methyl-D-erythritol 4-phosphate cytidylyltransferase [Flavobacteriales bacterium]
VEHSGEPVFLIEGNPENIKITTPLDLVLARDLIEKGWKV